MSTFEEFNNITIKNPSNKHIVEQFIKYYEFVYSNYSILEKTSREIYFKLSALKKNIFFLASLKYTITSGEQLQKYKGIGKKTVEKVNEIIKNGYISDLYNNNNNNNKELTKTNNKQDKDNQKKIKIIQELSSIYGIGLTKASEFYEKYNITSVDDLIKKNKQGKIKLTEQMLLGLKFKNTLNQKIPSILILSLDIHVLKLVHKLDKDFIIVFCGSYRREKEYPGDVDILITHKKLSKIENCHTYLKQIITILKNIIVAPITENYNTHFQAFGTFKNLSDLPNDYDKQEFNVKKDVFKLDTIIVPYDSFYTALMHFTGSGNFNKKIRIHAKSMDMKINEYGLYKIKNEKEYKIPISSEQDIFNHLSLKYLPPNKRY